ncbi:hypothetical protein SAMN05192559_101338 [Halobacillus karajensis]|uniref:Uncharacterized protein n=1 Tax=Halobacillus karajensis TaxID=195088 RepID=A0A059NWK1_9BACI|nr:hypothetical protein [Halobacillus karajensis]CDQ19015.1 hypothetical protein BN982_01297 [Halobacillus karajensis]CDQ22911.1 hypothetical protein BN983_01129 [Halobacillus karajensis]CDQ26393.1 hypothetical protein BN981_00609 [Halobacillus karajensis]SEH42968.1 hypothetical protein SAMN05192559_101338 [Halobacillus karajensis]
MFELPSVTFWTFIPWPFLWLGLATVMYLKFKREDENEEDMDEI